MYNRSIDIDVSSHLNFFHPSVQKIIVKQSNEYKMLGNSLKMYNTLLVATIL